MLCHHLIILLFFLRKVNVKNKAALPGLPISGFVVKDCITMQWCRSYVSSPIGDQSGFLKTKQHWWLPHTHMESITTHTRTQTHARTQKGKLSFQMTVRSKRSGYRNTFSKAAFHLRSSSLASLQSGLLPHISIWLQNDCGSVNIFRDWCF